MRWLLLVLIFDLTATDEMRPRRVETRTFASEAACNAYGRSYRERVSLPDGRKSFSICIPEDAYDQGYAFDID
jgi:hypothetical protein